MFANSHASLLVHRMQVCGELDIPGRRTIKVTVRRKDGFSKLFIFLIQILKIRLLYFLPPFIHVASVKATVIKNGFIFCKP